MRTSPPPPVFCKFRLSGTMLLQMIAVASTLIVGTTLAAIALVEGAVSDVQTHMRIADAAGNGGPDGTPLPPAWTKG